MSGPRGTEAVLAALRERAKELSCLYQVVEELNREAPTDEVLRRVLDAIPQGWQHPDVCEPSLVVEGRTYRRPGFRETPWVQRAPVRMNGREFGELAVYYTEPRPDVAEGPFLREERQLLNTLAERIGFFLLQRELADSGGIDMERPRRRNWREILDFLERMDPRLLQWIARKMVNHLRWKGADVGPLMPGHTLAEPVEAGDENRPLARPEREAALPVARVFELAGLHCGEEEVLGLIQMWISQDRVGFLIGRVEDQGASLRDITEALERFDASGVDEEELPRSVQTMLRVALLRRFFTDDIGFLNTARAVVSVRDFHRLSRTLLYPPSSHGKLGGKSAGLFLAWRIIDESPERRSLLEDIRIPRTWYIASDAVLAFVRHNNLEEVYDRKYLDIEQVRQQYPYVVQAFKTGSFPPDLVTGLSAALDDLADRPLIVRSSSLLEDRTGAAFSGKYKSLFLANRGTKEERLRALQDAVAEVYASIFSPDPIEYRAERGLLDVHEEMGIMIQEVVGTRVGRYFLPAFSGVAFSNNEFRWSARIRREDGLVRLVPGLGTRAVDRLSDDYPVLLAPGRPGLRANATSEETIRYSPRMVDLIDLEENRFDTVPVDRLLRECGTALPLVRDVISIIDGEQLRKPPRLGLDLSRADAVVTFEGLAADSAFLARIDTLLRVLRERLGTPVDIEFAHDGEHLYLLQCRPQSYGPGTAPEPIPRDLRPEDVLFSAHRHISNGRAELTHIVYIDPERYAALPDPQRMKEVGRVVGRLNTLLPKRRFILMGPGRWGSRGDVRLGVSVTYSDVNNTAVLAEIARRTGNYLPDLSFGTHFFQDLVEAEIRYLPLYPDEPRNRFNDAFLRGAENQLPGLLPEFEHLADVVRVIDVKRESGGRVLRVLMNGDQDEAVGVLAAPTGDLPSFTFVRGRPWPRAYDLPSDEHARWRMRMAEQLAARMDADRFGVRGIWVFGSTRDGTAGAHSDIDLLVHFGGDDGQRRALLDWLDGWSTALAEMNRLRTGAEKDGLIDAYLVSDQDVRARSGHAARIDAPNDAARRLVIGG